jgi:NTE family protein
MKMIKNLVFQGGGVKGSGYVGALRALEKIIDLKKIERVAGTSAGAIIATLLAVGCDIETLNDILSKLDFKAMLDDPEGGVNVQKKVLSSIEKNSTGKSVFFSKIPSKTVKLPILHRLTNQLGIFEGDYVRKWLEDIIQTQVKKLTNNAENGVLLTFGELHQLTEKYPGVFRDLYAVGLNLSIGKESIFSYENPDYKDVIISDAVRISMSIPYIFKPHHVYYKEKGERLVDSKRHIWVDGGLYNNYPIRCFDDRRYFSMEEGVLQNPETLGFRLVSLEYKDYFEGLISHSAPEKPINTLFTFTKSILTSLFAKQEDDHDKNIYDKKRSVYIDHLNISPLAFNLTEEQQQKLIISGQRATEIYFNGKTDIPEPELPENNDEADFALLNSEQSSSEETPEKKPDCVMQ